MPALLPMGSNLRNRYRIQSPITQTRSCNLYIAQDAHLTGKFWLVKEIGIYGFAPGDRSKLSQMFQAEAYQASALEHVCLPKLVDFFSQGQCLYIVREFVKGYDLASLLAMRRIIPELDVINVGIQLCDLLTYLQSKNFIAGIGSNLKLSNIVLQADGRIAVLDIGFRNINSLLKEDGGASAYPPPEQFTGAFSSDGKQLVYMVGSLLYHLLTNVNPAASTFSLAPLDALRQGLCAPTKAAITKSLRNDPRDRFSSLPDLRNSLAKAYQIAAKRVGTNAMPPMGAPSQSSGAPSWLWILGMIFACLIGGAMVVLYQMFLK